MSKCTVEGSIFSQLTFSAHIGYRDISAGVFKLHIISMACLF